MSPPLWPNLFIVGAAKAGTTSLYEYLRGHPDVFFPSIKEPHFFTEVRPAPEHRYAQRRFVTRREEYLALYEGAKGKALRGDASPSYLWCPAAPARIAQVSPEARIVVLLRDPIERAYSHYLMEFREGADHGTFAEALARDQARPEKGWAVSHLYLELGFYATQLARYFEHFPRAQVFVLELEELRGQKARREALARLCAFLGIDPAGLDEEAFAHVANGYAAPRAEWLRRLAGARWARAIGNRLVPERLGRAVFERFFLRPAPPPPIPEALRAELARLYAPEIDRLEVLLGRTLPSLRRAWPEALPPPPSRLAAPLSLAT